MPNPDEDFDDILNDVFNSQEERHRKVPAEAEAGWDASYAAYALIHATQELRRRQQ